MSIENGKLFDNCFWIHWDSVHNKNNWEEIEQWCTENCSGQWIIIKCSDSIGSRGYDSGYIKINIYSRAIHSPPTPYESYPAAEIDKNAHRLILFEELTDATAFKLKWMG